MENKNYIVKCPNLDQESLQILTKDTSERVIPKTMEETELIVAEFNRKKEWISESQQNFAQFFNEHGLDGDRLTRIVNQKIEAIKKVNTKFPELSKLNYGELKTVMINTYSQLNGKRATDCAKAYKNDMADCHDDFIGTCFWTGVGTLIAVLLETPVGAAGTVFVGVGNAYTTLQNCERRAVRDYRDCMGYPR